MEPEQPNIYKFLYGSQIYIKTAQFHNSEIEVIKSYMDQLYVSLKQKEKGYISSGEEGINYHMNMRTSSIWLCMCHITEELGE